MLTLILVPFVLVHLFFAIDRDSGTFLTIAQGLLDGYLPYRDFFDHKPPGLYYALAVALLLGKGSIWAAKVFVLVIAIATIGLINIALRALKADHKAIWWGVALGALGWVIYQGYTLVTETLVALLVIGALVFLLSEKRWALELAGFLIGLATLCKQPAFLFLIPVLAWAIFNQPAQSCWRLIVGFFGVILAGGLLLTILGSGRDAFEQIILANLLTPPVGNLREIVKGDFQLFFEGSPLWVATMLPLISQIHNRKVVLLTGMVVMGWLPALLNPTPHYLIPAVPIGAILAALGVRELEQNLPFRLSVAPVLLTIFPLWIRMLFPTLAVFSHMVLFQQIQAGRALADVSNPNEPILVVAAEPQYYFLAKRYPPGKDLYLLAINHTPRKETEMIEYLRSGLVHIIAVVDTPPTSLYASQITAYTRAHCTPILTFHDLDLTIWGHCR